MQQHDLKVKKNAVRCLPYSRVIVCFLCAVAIGLGAVFITSEGSLRKQPSGSWIVNEQGILVAQGNPMDIPQEVRDQRALIQEALFALKVMQRHQSLQQGPCLGVISAHWVADVVHDPRQQIDDLTENQCTIKDELTPTHVLELTEQGKIVRIR